MWDPRRAFSADPVASALQGPSTHALLLELQWYKDNVKCAALGSEVPGYHQEKLTQTLIVRLLKKNSFCYSKIGGPGSPLAPSPPPWLGLQCCWLNVWVGGAFGFLLLLRFKIKRLFCGGGCGCCWCYHSESLMVFCFVGRGKPPRCGLKPNNNYTVCHNLWGYLTQPMTALQYKRTYHTLDQHKT